MGYIEYKAACKCNVSGVVSVKSHYFTQYGVTKGKTQPDLYRHVHHLRASQPDLYRRVHRLRASQPNL